MNDQASDGTPGQFSGTEVYDYDQIGNLTETTSNGNLTKIDWDVYNEVKQVTNEGLLTRYLYDGAGNRVLTFKNVGFEDRRPVITGYSRDATGNTLAVYDLSNPEENPCFTPQMQETYIYGSNRIGVDITPRNGLGNYFVDSYHKDLTTTHYEISNHLGNVLTTVTGRKLGQPDPTDPEKADHYLPEVVTATDYYPFGSEMPGRSYENTTLSGTNGYRYAFNGKEHDSDGEFGSLTHYDFSARIYNPSIGRFLSVDEMYSEAPDWTPYRFGFNNPLYFIDPTGKFETKSEAKKYAKSEGIKTGWFRKNKIVEGSDGIWSIDNKSEKSTIYDLGDGLGIEKGVLFTQRGVHLKDIGMEGLNRLVDPSSEAYNPEAVIFTDMSDIAYALGSLVGLASSTARPMAVVSKTVNAGKGIDGLINAGNTIDKSGFTAVGRSLQKHGSRTGSVFPKVTGNQTTINAQGEAVLRGILTNPNTTTVTRHHARFGNIMDIQIPGGQGARFSADGKSFIHFLEP